MSFEHGMQVYVNCMNAYAMMTSLRNTVTLEKVSVDSDNVCYSW